MKVEKKVEKKDDIRLNEIVPPRRIKTARTTRDDYVPDDFMATRVVPPRKTSPTRALAIQIDILEDRLRRIRALMDQAADDKNRDPLFDEIEEILREMDYDNY